MKECSCCKENKKLIEFGKNKTLKDGLHCYCKICCRLKNKITRDSNPNKEKLRHDKYKKEHPEKRALTLKKYYKTHHAKCVASCNTWSKNNPEKVKKIQRKSKQKYAHKCNEQNARRKAVRRQQTLKMPEDRPLIQAFYKRSSELKRATGIQYHVDHIIPLVGKNSSGEHIISGLHVSWNLQVLSHQENESKNSKFDGTYENESWRLFI